MEAAPSAPALPAPSPASPRALRTQAFRAAIELCRARLAATGYGRVARFAAILITVGAILIAISIRATDGPAAPVGGLLRKAAGLIGWVSGGALALAAARDSAAADRADGIEALVAARGVGASLLRSARTLAATAQIARTIGLPLAVLAFATAALAADLATALRRVAAALALLAWGGVTGITLGVLAAACARVARGRGPTALLLLVLGERMVAESLGFGAWSVPGALHAALALILGMTGVGGGR